MSPAKLFVGFALVSLFAYGAMLRGWFQEDDYDILFHVARGGPFGMWTFAPTLFFRPLISLSFWIQYRCWGLDPVPYRIFNDLTHAGVATLVALLAYELSANRFETLGRWGAIGSDRAVRSFAVAAGLLFLVHPSHAEAVNWIAARTDLLSTFFGLLSLWTFATYNRTHSRKLLAASLTSFAAGLLCKESVLLVPLIAAAYALLQGGWPRLRAISGFVFVVLTYLFLRFGLVGTAMQGNLQRAHGAKLLASTVTEGVRALLPGLPVGNPDLNNVEVLKTPAGILYLSLGASLLLWLAYRGLRLIKSRSDIAFLGLAFLFALAPAAGLSVRLFRSQGERFVYFPSVFLVTMAVAIVASVFPDGRGKSRPILTAGFAAVCAACLALLQWQNVLWREGAELSKRVQASFVEDVVDRLPAQASDVALLNVPVAVQGAYGVGYVFNSVAELFRPGRRLGVEVVAAYTLRSTPHRVATEGSGSVAAIRLYGGGARFSLEATETGKKLDRSNLAASGYLTFEPALLRVDINTVTSSRSVYYWNGQRFEPWLLSLPKR